MFGKILTILLILIIESIISVATAQTKKYTISGYVTDESSSETLIGAGAVAEKIKAGATTNNYGFYTLTLPEGKVTLTYSYIGFSSQAIQLDLQKDTTINVRLQPNTNLKEAIVTARKDAGIHATNMSAMEIPIQQILKAPTLFGESDLMKVLQMLPGVQPGMEGTSRIQVRGGGPDENLILLDGIPIYNIDHILGIFSIFTPEAVKKVTFYKGAFPARYGGRISSIVDVRTNDGNMQETHGVVSVGTLTSRIHVEGPLKKDKTSYSLSLRGMHTLLYQPIMKLVQDSDAAANFYFYDVNAKLSHKFSDTDRLYLSVYNGLDNLYMNYNDDSSYDNGDQTQVSRSTDHSSVKWGNTVAASRWNHVFSNKIFSNTTLAFNRYSMNVSNFYKESIKYNDTHYKNDYEYRYKSGIMDWSAKMDFDYTPVPNHLIKFGGEYLFHTFRPETCSFSNKEQGNGNVVTDTTFNELNGKKLHGNELSLYAEDNFQVGDRLSLNPGLHLSVFNTDGKTYLSLQPRFSAKYSLGGGVDLKAAYSRMAQYVHLLASTDISLPTDLWVPITKNIKPVTGDQYSLGAYYSGLKSWEFSLEGYYKKVHNILEYKDGMTVMGTSQNWEEKVAMGEGNSYGAEVYIQKTAGRTTGSLAYTLAKSDRIFRDGSINNGKRYPYKYDRRHNLTLSFFHEFSKRVDIAATWVYTTEGTTTIPTRQTVTITPNGDALYVDYVPNKNNYRLPASHRLNLGVNIHKQRRHGERIWNFSLYNAYNAMNPNIVYTDTDYTDTDYTSSSSSSTVVTQRTRIKKVTILPIMPSISYTFKF